MRTLLHMHLCPLSRIARIMCAEKGLDIDLAFENMFEKREEFLTLNPQGQLPVLIDENNIVCNIYPIMEYLEEQYQSIKLMSSSVSERAEARRITFLFNEKFYNEVSLPILYQRIFKSYISKDAPDSEKLLKHRNLMLPYFGYIEKLYIQKKWLAGTIMSVADITVAAHISSLDYMGEIIWDKFGVLKEWYQKIKSRQSFKTILQDRIPSVQPYKLYNKLDF